LLKTYDSAAGSLKTWLMIVARHRAGDTLMDDGGVSGDELPPSFIVASNASSQIHAHSPRGLEELMDSNTVPQQVC
jgi:hypothetical protein